MNNEFSTKDLHFAAFLFLQDVNLIRLERRQLEYKERNPVYFIFDNVDRCLELEKIFWKGTDSEEIRVNAKQYVDAVRDLRARLSSDVIEKQV